MTGKHTHIQDDKISRSLFESLISVYVRSGLAVLQILCAEEFRWEIENEIYQFFYTCVHFLCSIFKPFFFLFSSFFHVCPLHCWCVVFVVAVLCSCLLALDVWVCIRGMPLPVGVAVKITDFSVPSSYVIGDENPDPLILDCAYESEPNEKGIVLKWHLNGTLIYQWIPDSPPAHARVSIPIASESRFNSNESLFFFSLALPLSLVRFICSFFFHPIQPVCSWCVCVQ